MGFVRSVRSVKVCWAVVSRGEGGGNDLKIVVGVLRQMALDNLFFFFWPTALNKRVIVEDHDPLLNWFPLNFDFDGLLTDSTRKAGDAVSISPGEIMRPNWLLDGMWPRDPRWLEPL